MGVPGFFLWLWRKYKTTNFVFSKKNIPYIDTPIIDNIDYLLLDMNCMIHPICFDTLKELNLKEEKVVSKEKLEKIEKKMMQNVIIYLEKTITIAQPRKGIYLAIDGVAPVAKMKQQRLRRYKSINDKELFDKIRKKHKKEIPFFWSNSAITPGTIFMENLTKILNEWSDNYMKQNNIEIIFSSSDEPSEGEHKLLQFIRQNQVKLNDFSYVIYGLDADLIFLMLTTGLDNIYLMREENNMEHKKTPDISDGFNFVSIRTMKKCIVESIEFKNKELMNPSRIIDDFIFICYLMGNDFLPHIPALDIYSGAIDKLLKIYMDSFNTNNCYIIDRSTKDYINSFAFFSFLVKLADTEELSIIESYGKKKKKAYCSSTDPFDIEMHKIDNMNFKINDPIMLGNGNYNEWRNRFYKHYYHVDVEMNEVDEFSKKMVNHYMIGLKWVTLYYFDKCPSWDWFYPFDHAPFLNDMIIETCNINTICQFKLGNPLTPYEQLLTVLPKESSYLLPLELRKIMLNPNSSVAHLYPSNFELDLIGKKKYWMAHPILPMLEINLIRKMYEKYSKLLNNKKFN
jgi:5'-3' exonuclease